MGVYRDDSLLARAPDQAGVERREHLGEEGDYVEFHRRITDRVA
jgi:hypothetical protein